MNWAVRNPWTVLDSHGRTSLFLGETQPVWEGRPLADRMAEYVSGEPSVDVIMPDLTRAVPLPFTGTF